MEISRGGSGDEGEARATVVWRLSGDATWDLGGCDKDVEFILRAKGTIWRVFHQGRAMICLRLYRDPSEWVTRMRADAGRPSGWLSSGPGEQDGDWPGWRQGHEACYSDGLPPGVRRVRSRVMESCSEASDLLRGLDTGPQGHFFSYYDS